jgi:hypothetical protein
MLGIRTLRAALLLIVDGRMTLKHWIISIGLTAGVTGCGDDFGGGHGSEPKPWTVIEPIERCRTLATPDREIAAAYSEARSLSFYYYGSGHPYCEATSHVAAHIASEKHGLEVVKIVTLFPDGHAESCGRKPAFLWHTVAAVPAGNDFVVLDPVYRCGTESLSDYLRGYVRADCPAFTSFAGCRLIPMEQWQRSDEELAGGCFSVIVPAHRYDLMNCGPQPEIQTWTDAALEHARRWIRPAGSTVRDFESRPGADPATDFECPDGS